MANRTSSGTSRSQLTLRDLLRLRSHFLRIHRATVPRGHAPLAWSLSVLTAGLDSRRSWLLSLSSRPLVRCWLVSEFPHGRAGTDSAASQKCHAGSCDPFVSIVMLSRSSLSFAVLQGYMYMTNSHLCFFAHMPVREASFGKSVSPQLMQRRIKYSSLDHSLRRRKGRSGGTNTGLFLRTTFFRGIIRRL